MLGNIYFSFKLAIFKINMNMTEKSSQGMNMD